MAITPRTILTSPGPATVAAVSLLAFTAVGTIAYKVAHQGCPTQQASWASAQGPCETVREQLGDQRQWSETAWVAYTQCFEERNDSRSAIGAASAGLRYHPRSESLYNVKGYHQIVLGDYDGAVRTLEQGLNKVGQPTNGVMQNNLAWAGLWDARAMERERARELYRRSLQTAPNACETLHTGLWVEYAMATESSGVERYKALKNFQALRRQYDRCQDRVATGEWKTLVEVLGATVLYDDVDRQLNVPNTVAVAGERDGDAQLERVVQKLRTHYKGASIDALCREAMPLDRTHHLCVDKVHEKVQKLKAAELRGQKAQQRQHAEMPAIRSADSAKANAGGGAGGTGCLRTY